MLVRAAVDLAEDAREWTRRAEGGAVQALAPDLIWAEVAHALRRYVRAGRLTREQAQRILGHLLELPIEQQTLRDLAPAVLGRAIADDISSYDAFYLVLAEAADAVVVTADRRLASASGSVVELIE